MIQQNRYVILEEGYIHTVLLTKEEAEQLVKNLRRSNPNLFYTVKYDEYYEHTDYYSEEEKEQINRLIP